MRDSVYDSVKLIGSASIMQSISGSSAVNGAGIDTQGMTDAALRVCVGIPTGSPSGASYVVTLQESPDNGTTAFANALDNTGAVIGFTITQLVGATGNTTNGSNTITSMSSVTGLNVGALITGTGIPAGTVVTGIPSSTSITISANATATNTGTTFSFSADGEARIEGLGGLNRKRYLRAVVTPTFTGGSSPAASVVAEIVQGGPPLQLPVNTTVSNT